MLELNLLFRGLMKAKEITVQLSNCFVDTARGVSVIEHNLIGKS